MRRAFFRTVLSAILLIVLISVYFALTKSSETDTKSFSYIFSISNSDLVEFSFYDSLNAKVKVVKEDGVWRIAEPIVDLADQYRIEAILGLVLSIRADRVIDSETPEFGIRDDGSFISVKSKDGTEEKLLIGTKNPSGAFSYAKKATGSKVYMISAAQVRNLMTSYELLRNLRILDYDQNQILKVFVARADRASLIISKQDEAWRIVDPVDAAVDPDKMDRFLNAITKLRAIEILDKTDQNKEIFDNLFLKIGYNLSDGKEIRVELSNRISQEGLYLKVDATGKDSLYALVDSKFLESIPINLSGIRYLRYFDSLDIDKVKEVMIKRDDNEYVKLVKDPADRKGWFIITNHEVKANADFVALFLDNIRQSSAVSMVKERVDKLSEYKLDNPLLTVELKLENQADKSLKIAKADDKGGYYYLLSSESYSVMMIDRDRFNSLNRSIADFYDNRFFKVDAIDISKVVIERLGQNFVIEKSGNGYQVSGFSRGYLNLDQFSKFVWKIINLQGSVYYDFSADSSEGKLLAKISIYDDRSDLLNFVEFYRSADKADSPYYGKDSEGNRYIIDARFLTTILPDLLKSIVE